jgi:hypothetical protein
LQIAVSGAVSVLSGRSPVSPPVASDRRAQIGVARVRQELVARVKAIHDQVSFLLRKAEVAAIMPAMMNSIAGQCARRRGWLKERKGHSANGRRAFEPSACNLR